MTDWYRDYTVNHVGEPFAILWEALKTKFLARNTANRRSIASREFSTLIIGAKEPTATWANRVYQKAQDLIALGGVSAEEDRVSQLGLEMARSGYGPVENLGCQILIRRDRTFEQCREDCQAFDDTPFGVTWKTYGSGYSRMAVASVQSNEKKSINGRS